MTELEARALIDGTALMVAVPSHDNRVDVATLRGIAELAQLWGDSLVLAAHDGFLPRSRDAITSLFLRSTHASHLLCVDSDTGFNAANVLRLLSHDVPVVAAVYARRSGAVGTPVHKELPSGGQQRGPLRAVASAGAGFLLLTRGAVERMCLEYARDTYGNVQALWMPRLTPDGHYEQEDEAFASRWRALGENLWLDTGCVVEHYGRTLFVPR